MHFAGDAMATEFRLLKAHSQTTVGPVGTFVAAEAFKTGGTIAGRTLSAIGLNFAEYFLRIVESDVPEGRLSAWTLLYTAGDKSLMEALGQDAIIVPALVYIHRIMEMSDEGGGHTDWRSNFAYVRSPIDQKLWAVHWTVNYVNEWSIGAVYVPHPDLDWRSGSRLFSNRGVPDDALVGGSHDHPIIAR
jgi:hypothetical protein